MPVAKLKRSGRIGPPPEPTPLAPPLSDAELSERLAQGDRWAQQAVYRKYVQSVWGLALRLIGNRADAELVVQNTFVQALRDPEQARDRRVLRSWLIGIAVRQVQRKLALRRLLRGLGRGRSGRAHRLDEEVADPALASELRQLGQLLDRLTPRRRLTWCLRYMEGCSLDEVAAYCACSLATTERALCDALRLKLTEPSAALQTLLDEPISELRVQEIWSKVQAPGRRLRDRKPSPLTAAACGLGAGVVVAGFLMLRAAPLAPHAARHTRHATASLASAPADVPHDGTRLTAAQATLLMQQAEHAQQRLNKTRAVLLLERVQRGASGSAPAALAGWTLAGMRMSTDPARAALDIQRALQDKLPEGLQETVRARLVEAHALAGASAAARAAADAYRATYPQGRYLAEVERWTHAARNGRK